MSCVRQCALCASIGLILFHASQVSAAFLSQLDDFEDGTTNNWTAGFGPGGGVPPFPPANVGSGGPLGADDSFLRLTSAGGAGPGSRLVAINSQQWSGDYTAAGITAISMDLRNSGNSDLNVRLLFEEIGLVGPVGIATTTESLYLPAGGGWTHAEFLIGPSSLTSVVGSVDALLSNVSALRIFHNPDPGFPPPAIDAVLDVDNIRAVPEPVSLVLWITAIALFGARAWRFRAS